MKTTFPKDAEIERTWYVIDAEGKAADRLAVQVADLLRGKGKPIFTPHLDTGDFVIVTNASKVKLTGNKESQKIYKKYTGYPSGLEEQPASMVRAKDPTRIVSQAVRGMIRTPGKGGRCSGVCSYMRGRSIPMRPSSR